MKKCSIVCWCRLLSDSHRACLLLIAFGCGLTSFAGIYKPTLQNVTPKATLEELAKGRKLYINNCASCHTLYPPERFDTIHWQKAIEKMAPKAKISNEDKALILKYVTKGQ